MYQQPWGYAPPPPWYCPPQAPKQKSVWKQIQQAERYLAKLKEMQEQQKKDGDKKKDSGKGPDYTKGHVFTVFQLWMFLTIFGLPMGLAHLWFTHALYKAATEFFRTQFQ